MKNSFYYCRRKLDPKEKVVPYFSGWKTLGRRYWKGRMSWGSSFSYCKRSFSLIGSIWSTLLVFLSVSHWLECEITDSFTGHVLHESLVLLNILLGKPRIQGPNHSLSRPFLGVMLQEATLKNEVVSPFTTKSQLAYCLLLEVNSLSFQCSCAIMRVWHPSGPHHPCGIWGKGATQRPPNNGPLVKVFDGHSTLPTICIICFGWTLESPFQKSKFLTFSLPSSSSTQLTMVNECNLPQKGFISFWSPLWWESEHTINMVGSYRTGFKILGFHPDYSWACCIFLSLTSKPRPAWWPSNCPWEGNT